MNIDFNWLIRQGSDYKPGFLTAGYSINHFSYLRFCILLQPSEGYRVQYANTQLVLMQTIIRGQLTIMGQCIGVKDGTSSNEEVPDVFSEHNQFQGELKNIVLSGVRFVKKIGIVVRICHIELRSQMERSPPQVAAEHVSWKFKKKFDFAMSLKDLEMSKVSFQIYHEDQSLLGQKQLSFYKACLGPSLHDYEVKIKNAGKDSQCRLSFNLRINQKFDLFAKTTRLQVELNQRMRDRLYRFKIKHIDENHHCEVSEYSQPFQNPAFAKFVQSPSQAGVDLITHTLRWDSEDGPQLWVRLNSHQVHHSCVQVVIQGFNPIPKAVQDSVLLLGEFFLSINELLEGDAQLNRHQLQAPRRKLFKKKVFDHGILIGEATCQFEITNTAFLRQIMIGIQTEGGLSRTSAIYDSSLNNKQVRQICQLQNQLEEATFKLESHPGSHKLEKELLQVIQNMQKLCKSSRVYANESELELVQRCMLGMLETLFKTADTLEQRLKDNFYGLMSLLIKSPEFKLNSLGVRNGAMSKSKQEIARKFLDLNISLLSGAVDKLSSGPALSEEERHFAERVCACSFFHFQVFQDNLLECVRVKEEFNDLFIEERIGFFAKEADLSPYFDWDGKLFKYVLTPEQVNEVAKQVAGAIDNSVWRQSLEHREILFYRFMSKWVEVVWETLSQHVPWLHVPGYLPLLKAMLFQMRAVENAEHPQALKEAVTKLLKNEHVIQLFVHLLFKKTKSLDLQNVVALLDLLHQLLQELLAQKKILPTSFNFSFFMRGLKRLLNSQHQAIVTKTLCLVYSNFQVFPLRFRREFTGTVLQEYFLRFIAHWSKILRHVFVHLLIFRLKARTVGTIKEFENAEMNERCDAVIELAQKAVEDIKAKVRHEQMLEMLPLHRKMKRKRQLKLRGESKSGHEVFWLLEGQIRNCFYESQPRTPRSMRELQASDVKEMRRKNSADMYESEVQSKLFEGEFGTATVTEECQVSSLFPIERQTYSSEKYLCLGMQLYDSVWKKYKNWPMGSIPTLSYNFTVDGIQPSLSR